MFVAVVVAGTTLLATQQPTPPRPQQQPVFRGGANLVQVDVYPTRDGKIVEGLTPADFQVFEDGKPQAVDGFEFIRIEPNTPDAFRRDPNTQEEGNQLAQDPRNRVFVVYLDYYHMNLVGSHTTRRPLVDFLNRMLSANDLFGVTTTQAATARPDPGAADRDARGAVVALLDVGMDGAHRRTRGGRTRVQVLSR